ncbi:helix-turn-helix transcriptional regulator [Alteromonas sp. a30]|uniref:helix-turn-helix transcriptional regulator n=1 Tax=Alteromonas sp. a30 TaxID=2730917 RepID=UPI00227DDB1F|nr:helix-turn-helix transcriptional regulator [Alteromonas sp. a30]MCY7296682.1 helix-turn-helix transcriptional regulator [Alteromonas sp. a30]
MRLVKGSDLRAMRMVAGLRTLDMASAAGVKTRKTYENWEKNIGTPSVNQFISMAQACGLSAADLISHIELSSAA